MSQVPVDPVFYSINKALYDPKAVLDSDEFEILDDPAKVQEYSASKKNIACCYNDKQQILMVKKPMPQVHPGQVLLHIRATGICGSDVHFWKHSRIGEQVVKHVCGAGHESAGEVIAVGEGVTNVVVGDRVAIEAGVPCSKPTSIQRMSRRRLFFHTSIPRLINAIPRPSACWVHKLPPNVSYEEGALLEPLVVALAGVERAGVQLGDPVLVTGRVPLDVTLLACHAAGASPIVITGRTESRLDIAKQLVPLFTQSTSSLVNLSESLLSESRMRWDRNPEWHLSALDTSSVRSAIFSVKFGGKVFVIGCGEDEQMFPFAYMCANEIDLQFEFRYANQYPKAIQLVSSGLIDVKQLVTHKLPLDRAIEAFHTTADPKSGSIKVQILDFKPSSTQPFHSINKALYDPRIVLDSEEFEILKEPAKILMVNKPMPKLHPGQVLLHVRATGICGSDVHFWKHAGCGAGHESAGEVIGVGEGVLDVHVGDRVAIEAGVPCSKPTCEMCRTGRYNACPDVVFFSTPPYHGLLTRFHAHPACWVHKLPANVSYEEGSLLEPLAVALASVEHAGQTGGSSIDLWGGPDWASHSTGLCCCRRLDFAKRIVPSVSTFRIVEGVSEPELGQRIQTMMGEKPQVALECTGRQSSVRTAIFVRAPSPRRCFLALFILRKKEHSVSTTADPLDFPSHSACPLGQIYIAECQIRRQGLLRRRTDVSAFHIFLFLIICLVPIKRTDTRKPTRFRYANQYPKAIKLVSRGLINVKPLVTHRFPLEEAVEAFHTSANPESGSIKVQIVDL
ncbi:hypothetical protein PSHT_02402, partial [Puccinia striiformis]